MKEFLCAQRFAMQHAPSDKVYNRIGQLKIIPCKVIRDAYNDPANPDHLRAWAHIGHLYDTVCVNPLYFRLPTTLKLGIILHEIGHIASDGDEMQADKWIYEHLGVEISYVGPDQVQAVSQKDADLILSCWSGI